MEQSEVIVKPDKSNSADEFLRKLLGPESKYFNGKPYNWIFRGVRDSKHELTPSALRKDAFSRYEFTTPDRNQIEHEWKLVQSFYMSANLRGLPLPDDSQRTHTLVQSYDPRRVEEDCGEGYVWPPPDLLPLVGLAQHYGIPTRFLDWTYDPRIASYFAARGVLEHIQESTPALKDAVRRYLTLKGDSVDEVLLKKRIEGSNQVMAVWAFFTIFDDSLRRRAEFSGDADPVPYEIVTVPNSTNPNIQAQRGVFTLVRHRGSLDTIDRSTLDQTLYEYMDRCFPSTLVSNQTPFSFLVRFELPWTECASLLRLLANLGIDASSVNPGFKGVADAVQEQYRWWDAPLRRRTTLY